MSRWGNTWTDEEVRHHLRKFARKDRAPVSVADSQPDVPDALDAKKQTIPVDQKFRVRITSRGRRLADTDGNSCKAAFDGITKAGIWPDDSSRFIEEISFTQEKAKIDETVIEVWEIAKSPDLSK